MAFSADDLRDIIEAQWSLTGEISKNATDNMKEPVQFFAYPQIPGNEVTKAVTVQKIQSEGNENNIEHPTFTEVQDIYEVTLYYRTIDVQFLSRDESFTNLEDMGDEVVRILRTQYSPSSGIGVYFQTQRAWTREDDYETAQPDLRRRLRFVLTTIESEDDTVFTGVNGLLIYDRDQGTGNQPGSDYTYTEANDVKSSSGYNIVRKLTRDSPHGIAKRATGLYSGTFEFETMVKEADVEGSTTNFIENIDALLSNGELPEVFLIKEARNKQGDRFRQSTRMQIIEKECLYQREDLARFRLVGEVIEPPVLSVT
ncbi:hypothetical protein LCGC14_0870680 [marine sediment metagenome]|uniref:Uncharacterized protein n=1 Tax=marine sediment metagenome TaxID=412755 RepID=A0A0F9RPI0_9ZZZZ